MTQATDLGNIANQLAQPYRQRVNVNLQALATQHYGAAEPNPMLPNMTWFSSGDGYIKVRNPTNTAWQTVGTIGPPMKWTNVDIPSTAWKTGDIKPTFAGSEAGWVLLDDGTIGDQYSGATNRANPDTWPLYSMLWPSGAMYVFVAGTWTPVGKGASAAADFNAHRHLSLPRVAGRAPASAGQGLSMTSSPGTANLTFRWWTDYNGEEAVQLVEGHMPGHYHTVPGHNHALARALANYVGGNSSSSGPYTLADQSSGVASTESYPGGVTGWSGGNAAHNNIGPRFYCFFLCKL